MTPFEEGQKAYWENMSIGECPYPHGSGEEEEWEDGWYAAEDCDEEE